MQRSILPATRTFMGKPPQPLIRGLHIIMKEILLISIVSGFRGVDNIPF
jgi:hypothetical protein